MGRFGDYETDRQLASRGLTSVFIARRVSGAGPRTAVVKVLRLPEELVAAEAAEVPEPRPPVQTAPEPARDDHAASSAVTAAPGGAASVFISHSTTDKVKADAVCAALEQAGVRCWIAPRDILPGAAWAASILRAIGESKLVVLLLSEPANQSPHIRREVERAVSRNVPIAPVRVQNVMPRDDLEYFLSASHWVDAIAEPFEQHLPHLVSDVRAILSAQGVTLGAADGNGHSGAGTGPRTAGTAARAAAVAVAEPRPAPSPAAAAKAAGANSVARAAMRQFTEAAEVQRIAADASPHWGRVYDAGEFPGGAFVVEEHCRHSVQRLIEGNTRLDAAALHLVVSGMIDGLTDLHRTAGRPHGDVEASNVLLRADPREPLTPDVVLVALTDPLSTPQLTPRHTVAADVQGVGRLMYQLVMGERADVDIPEKVEPSPEWQALGKVWRKWVELCTLMLDAPPRSTAITTLVRERLGQLKPRPRRVSRAVLATASVGAGLFAIAAVPVARYYVVPRLAGGGDTGQVTPTTAPADDPGKRQPSTTPPLTSDNAKTKPVPDASPVVDVRPDGGTGSTSREQPPPAANDVLGQLMAARNSRSTMRVALKAELGKCTGTDGECVSFTITSDRPGYLILLTRDLAGEVSLLVPNPKAVHVEEVRKGETKLPLPNCGYEFPVGPPYGRTWMKAIIMTRPVEVVVGRGGAEQGAFGPVLGLKADGRREAATLAELLQPGEWATAECEVMTRDPAAAAESARPADGIRFLPPAPPPSDL